ncbi:MAG: hypothetical protein H0V22_10205, partial [Solirubrobacterales bacterium]|nr:hypothetical protein [Solirubrobacterales bacterium]
MINDIANDHLETRLRTANPVPDVNRVSVAAVAEARSAARSSWRPSPSGRRLRRGSVVALALFTVSGSALAVVVTRDDTYLNATSRELAGTPLSLDAAQGELGIAGRDVKEIRKEMIIQGHEVYAIEGPRTRCILIAGV